MIRRKLYITRSDTLDDYALLSDGESYEKELRPFALMHEDELFDTLGLDSRDQIYQEYQRTGEVYIELDIWFTG